MHVKPPVCNYTVKGKGKVKVKSLSVTSVVPSVTRLVSMELDGATFTPLPLSVLSFTDIQSYRYTDQRKVETDVEVTEDRTGELSLRKPRTSQLSHDCSKGYPLCFFLKNVIRRTFYDLYCLCLLLQVMMELTRRLRVHLVICQSDDFGLDFM